jgi:hypothetical protein
MTIVPNDQQLSTETINFAVQSVNTFAKKEAKDHSSALESPDTIPAMRRVLLLSTLALLLSASVFAQSPASAWEALSSQQQEHAMGRTKLDSVELENKPADSHVARTDQDEFGNIFRRNMPYGIVQNHGTMFVGFSSDQTRLSRMLDSMAGLLNGTRDALTRYTEPLTGSYYFVPSVESLRRLR